MTSRFTDDESAVPERSDTGSTPRDQPAEQPAASAEPAPAAEAATTEAATTNEGAEWSEPKVAAQRILVDVFRSGGKSSYELEELLNRQAVDPAGFIDYWCRENFLREIIKGTEKRFELSKRAVLELELEVA